MEINRNTIIKNLVKKHPETLSVFRKYNLVVAGGVRGLMNRWHSLQRLMR
jgi:tRNA A37 threonylcarbamoyltransferase TsaD